MGRRGRWLASLGVVCAMCCTEGCDKGMGSPPFSEEARSTDAPGVVASPSSPDTPTEQVPPDSHDTPPPVPPPPTPDLFRTVFHQPLEASLRLGERTPYRFRLPVAAEGTRLRFVFQAGDGPLVLHGAQVARAEAGGEPGSEPVALTFLGAAEAGAPAGGLLRSDPLTFPMRFREELVLTFEVEGAVAAGTRPLFPESVEPPEDAVHSSRVRGPPGRVLVGLSAIEVEAAEPGRCVAVVGAGARAGSDSGDVRETWPAVAERLLGTPVLDFGAEGQGAGDESRVRALLARCGEPSCVVLPEAEAVDGASAEQLQTSLSALFERLHPLCQVYAGTLPPDARASSPRSAVNAWLRNALPPEQLIDLAGAVRDARAPGAAVTMGDLVARRLGSPPAPEPAGALALEVTYQDPDHEVLAMDPQGTVYAVRVGDSHSRLWASTDNARTWKRRGTAPEGTGFFKMTSLADGTLLANVRGEEGFALARSTNQGASWKVVLTLGGFRMLQPHSIRELHGTVFYLEYQTFSEQSPIRLWVSRDQGASWQVRYTFLGRRHGHSLVADERQGVLWALMGDLHGGLLRSVDEGRTWRPVVEGPPGVAVDAVVTPRGLLFGTDNLFAPPLPAIKRVGGDDTVQVLAPLPGPSYSLFALPGGGYVLGTTRETGGDVYAPGDVSAHVLLSADGVSWSEFHHFPRLSEDDYARADVYWQLPSGELLLELSNVRELGSPRGFQLLKAVRH